MKRRIAAILGLAVLVTAAAPAGATISPRTCGTVKHKGKRYVIKTHQLSCSKGKPYATNYLRYRRKPSGWRCTDYNSSQTSVKFTCRRRNRDFLAIRR